MDTITPTASRTATIDRVAHLWVQGLADQDARSPEDAARAAGCSKPETIAGWVAKYRPEVAVAA